MFYLESNGLMSSNEDPDSEIVSTDDLREPSVLSVGETNTSELLRNLESKGSEIPEIKMFKKPVVVIKSGVCPVYNRTLKLPKRDMQLWEICGILGRNKSRNMCQNAYLLCLQEIRMRRSTKEEQKTDV